MSKEDDYKGWQLLVLWRDGSELWIPLKDLKELNLVEVAKFAKARRINTEPSFGWWVSYTLKKRAVIPSTVNTRVRQMMQKYGIEMHMSVEDCYEINHKIGNTCWHDAIEKEMMNIGVTFEILPEGQLAPNGCKKATGHLVFDVKMDFTQKARWVLDRHKTPDILGLTYAIVLARESIHIVTEFRQPIQVQSHLEMPGILIQLGHIQRN